MLDCALMTALVVMICNIKDTQTTEQFYNHMYNSHKNKENVTYKMVCSDTWKVSAKVKLKWTRPSQGH